MPTFQQTHKTITESKEFQEFKQKHPNSELCAGFFILDFLSNDTKKSLDYISQGSDKVFTFDLADDGYIKLKEDKLVCPEDSNQPKLTPLQQTAPKIEVDELKSIIGTKKLEQGISAPLHKIIAVLQNHEDKLTWNLTCMLDQLIIIHALVNAETGEITKFERKNMMDFIKKK